MSPVTFSPATRSANLSRQAPPRASASPPEPRPDQVNLEPTSLAPARSDKKWLLPFGIIAGLGVAFRAKPLVKQSADQSISTLGLDAILYLLGLSDRYQNHGAGREADPG